MHAGVPSRFTFKFLGVVETSLHGTSFWALSYVCLFIVQNIPSPRSDLSLDPIRPPLALFGRHANGTVTTRSPRALALIDREFEMTDDIYVGLLGVVAANC